MPTTTTQIGARIRAARTARGLTQDDLADRLGIHQATVSRWELGGTITVEQLVQVAEALDIALPELVGGVAA